MLSSNCRNTKLDLLKIYAALLVLILHVGGYTMSLNAEEDVSSSVLYMYYLCEAFAYPAIHLFVMIGSWLMIEKPGNINRAFKVWAQTWIVSMTGLIIMLLVQPDSVNVVRGIISVFPFLGRAYWFVSDYIILILLSPFLNYGIEKCNDVVLRRITLLSGAVISIFPTFLPIFPWHQDYSNIGLFVLLYLITAMIKRNQSKFKNKIWRFTWVIPGILLTISAVTIHVLKRNIPFLEGRELELYEYNSVFVILEAILIFIAFLGMRNMRKMEKVFIWISSGSLVVYLIHMHPVVKEQYTKWKVFKYINIQNSGIYLIQMLSTCLLIFVMGTLAGRLVCRISDSMVKKVSRVIEKAGKR